MSLENLKISLLFALSFNKKLDEAEIEYTFYGFLARFYESGTASLEPRLTKLLDGTDSTPIYPPVLAVLANPSPL